MTGPEHFAPTARRLIAALQPKEPPAMSTIPLNLDGWDEQSTFGYDPGQHTLYAQLTRNGDDRGDEGPEIWLTPPDFTTLDLAVLTAAIAAGTGRPVDQVTAAVGNPRDLFGSY